MSFNASDPKVSAYAFGELEGAEKAAFETELAASQAARDELREVERTIGLLRDALGESPPALDAQRRGKVEEALQRRRAPRRRRALWVTLGAVVPLAACVALAVGSMRMRSLRGEADEALPPSPMSLPSVAASASAMPMPIGTAAAPQNPAAKEAYDKPSTSGEKYDSLKDNPFVKTSVDPRSTFSVDVDTASYANARRLLEQGVLPPAGAVRIEEFINYFHYGYPEPQGAVPFSVQTDVASAPWAPGHRLVKIGIKGKHVKPADIPGSNLVFLIDTSGSMSEENKLPLLKRSFSLLVEELDDHDRVSIVAYAGSTGLVLPPTSGADKKTILSALDRLESGGPTNGGQGIQLAYATALEHMVRGGINRVILATDGDFNVGVTSSDELVKLVETRAKGGVFLSVLGFGGGNYNDSMLEKLADKGNGNYAYVDSFAEAKKVLVEQATGTLLTIAKDVKIQVEFDPKRVQSFRLIGYENRVMSHSDFHDDKKDAGEIGADHTVTALYEVVSPAERGELGVVKLRYKLPTATSSEEVRTSVKDDGKSLAQSSPDLRFAAAVAEFGMLLRDSPHKGMASFGEVMNLAEGASDDERRSEFLGLVRKAKALSR